MKQRKMIFKIALYIVGLGFAFICLYWLGKNDRKKIAHIDVIGIETIGTITNRSRGRSARSARYSVHFDFEHNGQRIVKYQTLHNNSQLYEQAIIGMKYKVKYLHLPNSSKIDAVIYINEPIVNEYVNIEKERERIFRTNKSAKRKARSLEDIQYLIPVTKRNIP